LFPTLSVAEPALSLFPKARFFFAAVRSSLSSTATAGPTFSKKTRKF
jgi:hypothetical protein